MSDRSRPELTDAELMSMLRGVTASDHVLENPPSSVWTGIEQTLGAERATESAASTYADPAAGIGGAPAPDTPATPVRASLTTRSRPRWRSIAAIAATLVMLVVGVSVFASKATSNRRVTLAAARLSSDGLPDAPAGLIGGAEVIKRGGKVYLRVTTSRLSPKSGEYLELWMIDTNVKGMVSIGIVDQAGDYELPTGLRFADFPIVDISSEPYDGNPTHSGHSLLRGTLA